MYITIKPYKKNKTIFIVSSMLKSGITIFPLVCRLLVSKTANSLFKTNILCYLICFTIIVSKTEKNIILLFNETNQSNYNARLFFPWHICSEADFVPAARCFEIVDFSMHACAVFLISFPWSHWWPDSSFGVNPSSSETDRFTGHSHKWWRYLYFLQL